ncbi:MAG: metallophosphoesterase [Chloroflexota bacterium]
MKLLLFSDLHNSQSAAMRLVEMAAAVDVLVGAGDFATVRRGIEITIDILKQTGKTAVLVPGNSESFEELQAACGRWQGAHVLHGSSVTIDGLTFAGLGGGIPVTPFGSWSYDFSDEEASQLLASAGDGCDVLVSHSPPFGAVDVSSSGRQLGSRAIRTYVEAKQPRLVVCGHIHASAGKQEMVGKTAVINAGPNGIIYEL